VILTTAMTLLLLQTAPAATPCVPPPKTPVPVSALRTLRCADGQLAYAGDTVTIAGRVTIGTAELAGRVTHLVIQDSTGGITFLGSVRSGFAAQAGDSVVARGVLLLHDGLLALEGIALNRLNAPPTEPVAYLINLSLPALARVEGRYIEVTGRVAGKGGLRQDQFLYLDNPDDSTAHVTVEAAEGAGSGTDLTRFNLGDIVRVTGVLLAEGPGRDSTQRTWVIHPRNRAALAIVNSWQRRERLVLTAGAFILFLAILYAVLERVRAKQDQRALVASRVWFTSLIEGTSEYMLLLDPKGTVIFASPSVERVLGVQPRELVGANSHEGAHPDDEVHRRAAFDRALAKPGIPQQAVYRRQHGSDGRWVYLAAAFRNLLDDPVVRGVIVNVRDISEERRIAEELELQEQHYRQLVDALPFMVYSVEPTPPYNPTFVSRGHESLGYTREEWMQPGRWRDVVHPDDRDWVLAEVALALELRTPTQMEYRVIAKDGTVRWLSDTGRFTFDQNGKPLSWNGAMIDVTDRIEAEQALREAKKERA
jgi:PAS domain S-box-containing protein